MLIRANPYKTLITPSSGYVYKTVITSSAQLTNYGSTGGSGGGSGTGSSAQSKNYILQLMHSSSMQMMVHYYYQFNNTQNTASGSPNLVYYNQIVNGRDTIYSELNYFQTIYNKNYPDFNAVYDYVLSTYQAIVQAQSYINSAYMNANANTLLQEKEAILSNPDKLREIYLELIKHSNMFIIPETEVTAPIFTLLPEIQRYVDLYGYPPNGAFDPRKMAEIMHELGIVITETVPV